jgi:hypothetical protein
VIVESGDILTVVGALILVVVIAIIANPQYLQGIFPARAPVSPTIIPTSTSVPALTTPVATQSAAVPSLPSATETLPVAEPTPLPPYRIFYTDNPFSYPNVRLPDQMRTIGESDIPRSGQDVVNFAYLEDTRGGLTRVFSIPYPVWMLNITVNASRTPQLGNFRMALCYAGNGTIIDGAEILNQGTAYKKIQTSNTDLYIIVSTANIDRYHMDFLTTREYYDLYRPVKP